MQYEKFAWVGVNLTAKYIVYIVIVMLISNKFVYVHVYIILYTNAIISVASLVYNG